MYEPFVDQSTRAQICGVLTLGPEQRLSCQEESAEMTTPWHFKKVGLEQTLLLALCYTRLFSLLWVPEKTLASRTGERTAIQVPER